eukprot:SAG22_NODE_719_length_7666_cov_5.819083_6_plen_428_part_00
MPFLAVCLPSRTRARSPNTGSNYIVPLGGYLGSNGFRYRDGDLNPRGGLAGKGGNLSEVEIVVYASWCTSRHHIAELNTTAGALAVTLTGSAITDMWPNSGNRYYAENAVEFVDAPGEWYVSDAGLLTIRPPAGMANPAAAEWVLDRGDGLKTGLQLKDDETIGPAHQLVPTLAGGAPAVVLPAAAVNLAAAAWNLSIAELRLPAGKSGVIMTRGPVPAAHVPGDTTFSVQSGGNLMMDFGWAFTLIGSRKVNDGKPHRVEVGCVGQAITLSVDGVVDTTLSHPNGVRDGGVTWRATFASPPNGGLLKGVSFAASQGRSVGYMSFEHLTIAHVGWGTLGNMQSASFLDSAAVHLHNASHVNFQNVSVGHVGGYAVWVEGGSRHVRVDAANITDCSGGIRVGALIGLSKPRNLGNSDPGLELWDILTD